MRRLKVEYDAKPSLRTPNAGVPLHRVLVAAKPGDFYQLTAHAPAHHPWQADPFAQELYIFRGTYTHVWPFSRAIKTGLLADTRETLPDTAWGDVLLAILPEWHTDELPPSYKCGFEAALDCSGFISIWQIPTVRHPRARRGRRSATFFGAKDLDRIWVSSNKLAILKRELRDRENRRVDATHCGGGIAEHWRRPSVSKRAFVRSIMRPRHYGMPGTLREQETMVRVIKYALNDEVAEIQLHL